MLIDVFFYFCSCPVGDKDKQRPDLLNRRVNVEIEEDDEGTTKWYIGVIKEVEEGTCTISFDGFDSSHNIQVLAEEIPSEDIIFL